MDILETKTDIGLIRETNEDKAIALMHPKNKNIKLLAVADGMGGKEDGELASNYIVNSLEKWFKNKSIKTLNNTVELEKLVKSYVKRLNTALVRKYGDNHLGSTLTLAIINKKHTLFINCGDSRGYIYKKNELFQVTSDDSDVWYYYKYGHLDVFKFFRNFSGFLPASVLIMIFGGLLSYNFEALCWSEFFALILVFTIVYIVVMYLLGMNIKEKEQIRALVSKIKIAF